ncbi:CehA/McbA family metallohydrolase [Paenibacillus sp. UNC451MF]|uniref:CehA/McbA family metallohydrolase n=1 Tax=Paenibacillus sp. UNC451MF TaxID=1449063 RepID=UPI00049210D5|nr:CehA/McbA family metallohydrolase [Paenibacillus sp. UNC451MF]
MDKVQRPTVRNEFQRCIARSEQGMYIEIPFEVPDHAEELAVTYLVESFGEARAVIDLGVRDTGRVRGWSGGARKEFRIGLEQATPGYVPGKLHPGSWAVLHNAYRVPEEGCQVTVTVEVFLSTSRWLKGDLHTHSIHSDGTYSLEENAAIMEQLGCDFIAMTDHNAISQNYAYPRNTAVLMIQGMEFTTNCGHSNFLGVTEPLDDFRVENQADVNERIRMARERGARIVLNHPHCDFCPWEWDFNVDFDWVEVWNGPWTDRNARALEWWQEQLVGGRRLTAVGGSDVHRPDKYVKHAMPCTWVYAETKATQGILNAISKGHVCISYAPEGPFLELSFGTYRTGDSVPKEEREQIDAVTLNSSGLLPGDRVRWITEKGLVKEEVCTSEESEAVSLNIQKHERTGPRFVRVEVWRHFKEVDQLLVVALTNPIYFDAI